MAAPKGNKNREHWTYEEAEKLCNAVYEYILENEKCRSISTACAAIGYYETLFDYLEKKFNVEFESLKKSRELVKSRLIEQGLDGKANATMAIFILKNNHNMADKVDSKNDHTTNGKELDTSTKIIFK